jgi:pilus assembly protein Flp/PilA
VGATSLKRRAPALADEGQRPYRRYAQKEEVKVNILIMRLYGKVVSLRDREEGQALVEYALLLSLIAIASIVVLTTLGGRVSTIFSNISHSL